MAAHFLEKAGVAFEKIMADDNAELVAKYDIHQAPTLVVVSGGEVQKFVNLSNIKAFTEQVVAAK